MKKALGASSILSGAYTAYLIIKEVISKGAIIMEHLASFVIVLIFIVSTVILIREKYKELKTKYLNNLESIKNKFAADLENINKSIKATESNATKNHQALLSILENKPDKPRPAIDVLKPPRQLGDF